MILTVILGTDMQHHFEQISKTQLFVDINGDETKAFYNGETQELACLKDDKNRLFIMELVLHCSDISNPYKPFKICAKWADLVVEEFWRQGDREREEGLEISNMCDRNDGGTLFYIYRTVSHYTHYTQSTTTPYTLYTHYRKEGIPLQYAAWIHRVRSSTSYQRFHIRLSALDGNRRHYAG